MNGNLSGETRLVPIIGDPIIFVKIPPRLTSDLARLGHNTICVPMRVADGDLDQVMKGLSRIPNIDGLLVTMPHKFTALAWCATSSRRAKLAGAVSVMRRNNDGSWHGDMLDGLAFVKAQIDGGAQPRGARVLLAGAGAAGSAIAIALLEAEVRELVIHDIDASRTARLIALLSDLGRGRVAAGPPDPAGFDMVCNATPMGLDAGDPLPLAANRLAASMFVGDVIAGHGVTPLLRVARAAGCRTADGVQMVEAGRAVIVDFLLGK